MSDKATDYRREVRDTIVKSGFTGVAATVLAVTIFSPAGLGGMIGTSLASGLGLDSNSTSADDPYANLPAYPAPLTADEINDIRGQLARTTASLEITRAATEAKIDHIRSIAEGAVTFAPMPQAAPLRFTTIDPVSLAAPATIAPAPQPPSGIEASVSDPSLELAELLLAHETL